MNKKLDRLEARLRSLFEESLIKALTGHKSQITLIDDLIQVMRENLAQGLDGDTLAPDRFLIHIPPDDLLEWQVHQDILNDMAASIYHIRQEEDLIFQRPPTIEVHIDTTISNHNYAISAQISDEDPTLPDTAAMTQPEQTDSTFSIPKDASLIIGGTSNFPLKKSLINIGRHSDNDLVLDDPHVSRHHAQLRAIRNQFVIFDVGSTGGTFLNGRAVSKATLQTGDVIRIGVVNLIYTQDTTSPTTTTAMPIEDDVSRSKGDIE